MPALTEANLSRLPLIRQASTNGLLPQLALTVAHVLVLWDMRIRTRRALRRLDDFQIRDIGLTRIEVLEQAKRPFWKA